MFGLSKGQRAAVSPRHLSGRGLAYWTDGQEDRNVYVTPGYQCVALDAKTGGRFRLRHQWHRRPETKIGCGNGCCHAISVSTPRPSSPETSLSSAPRIGQAVCHRPGQCQRLVRGFDVRTGKRLWIFNTIPSPGEFGNDTWLNDSWSYTGNTGAWAQISVDEELGLAYLPVESPTGDYFGGHRPGTSLFGESSSR